MSVSVKITSTYSDSYEAVCTAIVRDPAEGESVDDWFQDAVFPHTGDGHGLDSSLGSCYTAEVIAAADPALVGELIAWVD